MSSDLLSNGNITFFADVSRAKILHGLTFGATLCFVPLSCNVSPQHLVMEDRHQGFVASHSPWSGHWPSLGAPRLSRGMGTHTENQSHSSWINTPSHGTHKHLHPFLFHSLFRCTTTTMLTCTQASHHHTTHNSKTSSHR